MYLEFRCRFGIPDQWNIYQYLSEIDNCWDAMSKTEKEKFQNPVDVFLMDEQQENLTKVHSIIFLATYYETQITLFTIHYSFWF